MNDELIKTFLKSKYNLVVGEKMLKNIKNELQIAYTQKSDKMLVIKGRDFVTGLPNVIQIMINVFYMDIINNNKNDKK